MSKLVLVLCGLVVASCTALGSVASAQVDDPPDPRAVARWEADPLTIEQILKALPANARPAADGSWSQTARLIARSWADGQGLRGRRIRFRVPVNPKVTVDPVHRGRFRMSAVGSVLVLQNLDGGAVVYSEPGFEGGPACALVGFDAEGIDAAASERLEQHLADQGLLVDGTVETLRFVTTDQLRGCDGAGDDSDGDNDNDTPAGLQGILAMGRLAFMFPGQSLGAVHYPLVQVIFQDMSWVVTGDLDLGLGKMDIEDSPNSESKSPSYDPHHPFGYFMPLAAEDVPRLWQQRADGKWFSVAKATVIPAARSEARFRISTRSAVDWTKTKMECNGQLESPDANGEFTIRNLHDGRTHSLVVHMWCRTASISAPEEHGDVTFSVREE